jgi:hypothetical protein
MESGSDYYSATAHRDGCSRSLPQDDPTPRAISLTVGLWKNNVHLPPVIGTK